MSYNGALPRKTAAKLRAKFVDSFDQRPGVFNGLRVRDTDAVYIEIGELLA
jgi:hypothetical protein